MTRRSIVTGGFILATLFLIFLAGTGCSLVKTPAPTSTPQPTLALTDTQAKVFTVTDFGAVHQEVSGAPKQYLIFGNIPFSPPPPDLPADLAVYLGRWEGYASLTPLRNDRKLVLVISEISTVRGKMYAYSGANLQSPDIVSEIDFRVEGGTVPSLHFLASMPDGKPGSYTFTYDPAAGKLTGWIQASAGGAEIGPFELTHARNFFVYTDYQSYLESLHIYAKIYQDASLSNYGAGYLVYLPDGYAADPQKTWPLIFFLHGMGNTGGDLLDLAANSPMMFICQHGPLPAIIIAPLAGYALSPSPFPDEYMEGVLRMAQTTYRVDPSRIYLTGLSMGGEATWRFAVHHPETFAAVAPLSAYYTFSVPDMTPLVSVPVWAIHGADDRVIPLELGRIPVDALKAAGGNVKFTILQGHDHDTWTDTYSDPAFYDWLFQYQKQ